MASEYSQYPSHFTTLSRCTARTTGKPHIMTMGECLKNIEIRGSTMGSFEEFKAAIAFIEKHKIRPVIHKTILGLENAEDAFRIMKDGEQFGKLVIKISNESPSSKL